MPVEFREPEEAGVNAVTVVIQWDPPPEGYTLAEWEEVCRKGFYREHPDMKGHEIRWWHETSSRFKRGE